MTTGPAPNPGEPPAAGPPWPSVPATGPPFAPVPATGPPFAPVPATGPPWPSVPATGPPFASVPATAPASVLLRDRGAATWSAAVGHPMVAEIGAGTLPHETFRYYFEQNVRYLEDYARAIALIIGHAPGRADVAVLTRFLVQIVQGELPANYSFLARLGGRPDAPVAPTTYAYTRHLLDAAGRGDLATGLAAVLPCQWSYGEIAAPLAAALPADPVYAEWISMFAGDSYDELVHATTGLLDRHTDRVAEARMTELAAVFDRSTGYELAFWDMAYTRGQSDQAR
jgi:thiaminase (transcriptional activator TenA)